MKTYPTDPTLLEQVNRNFTHHPPKKGQPQKYNQIRESAQGFAHELLDLCPPSRERSLAFTKLEETVMWANASIARNETGEQD